MENLPISASEWGAEQGAKFRGVPLGDTTGGVAMKKAMVLIVSAMRPEHGTSTAAPLSLRLFGALPRLTNFWHMLHIH